MFPFICFWDDMMNMSANVKPAYAAFSLISIKDFFPNACYPSCSIVRFFLFLRSRFISAFWRAISNIPFYSSGGDNKHSPTNSAFMLNPFILWMVNAQSCAAVIVSAFWRTKRPASLIRRNLFFHSAMDTGQISRRFLPWFIVTAYKSIRHTSPDGYFFSTSAFTCKTHG